MKSIIELAREAGFHKWYTQPEEHPEHAAIVARFAALVRAAALEEAAGVCDNSASHCHHDGLLQVVLKSNAAAIRALKEMT